MPDPTLDRRLAAESKLPVAVNSGKTAVTVHGWLPAKPRAATGEGLPASLEDWVKRADALGDPVPVGGFTWQPALYHGVEMYAAGLLVRRAGTGALTSIVVKIPPGRRPPKIPRTPDPAAAIKFVRAGRALPGDLDDPPVPTPKLVWFDPYVVLGEAGPVALAWRFSFTGERCSDVIVSLDGTHTLAVIATDPENPYAYATTPRYLLDDITGVPRFVSFVPALLLTEAAAGSPIAVAEAFFRRFPAMFGTAQLAQQLRFKQVEPDLDGGQHIVFQQIFAGVLVWGCELRVHLNDRLAITSISGRYYRDPDVDLGTKVSEQAALSSAMTQWLAANGGVDQLGGGQAIEQRGLVILPWKLVSPTGWNSLAWWFRFPDADRFISAQTGRLIVAISRRHSVRRVYDLNGQRPGAAADLQLEDGIQRTANPLDPEALTADAAIAAVEAFWRMLARNSWDGGGGDTIAYVDVNFDDPATAPVEVNASWNGSYTAFSRNLAEADIVGHEFSHAVTEKTAGLVYVFEPGAMNESFSDVFGKLIVPTPQPWVIGAGSIGRDLRNPAATLPPNGPCADNYASNYQFRPIGDDLGGVHFNSGIGNRAAVLVADGDGSAAHPGLGRERLARIWWDALTTRLSPWSSYIDLVANAWEVARALADGGRRGVQFPGAATQPPAFTQSDPNEVLWAFRQVGLDLRLQAGWFRVPSGTTTDFVFFEGVSTPTNERVSDVIVRVTQRRSGGGTRFMGVLQVSTGTTTAAFGGGVVNAAITQHGVNSQSMEVRVRVTTANFSDVEVSAQVLTQPITPAPVPPPPTLPYVTPHVAHWFDNPLFLGRRYGDIVYEAIDLPASCAVSDVELELIDGTGRVLASTRFGQPAATEGARGAWIFARSLGGTRIEVRVRSWHDFGTAVRYRLVYWITADSCSLPAFTIREVGPDNL